MMQSITVQARDGYAKKDFLRPVGGRMVDEYDLLIEGICRQASRDLRGKVRSQKFDAMDFFRSKWFERLTGLDGEMVIQKLLD
jgi:hypothetical protein